MRKDWPLTSVVPLLAILSVVLLATAGCASSTSAQAATSLVRARPTTLPETYTLQFSNTVTALRGALDRLGALLSNPHYMHEAWKSDAVDLATQVELGYRQLEGLSPPDEQIARYSEAVRAVQACQTLTLYVFQGVNNLDKGPFDEVQKRVDACRSQLDTATGVLAQANLQAQPASTVVAASELHVRAKRGANLRGGPGTNYPVVATATAGDQFTVTGRTAKGDWLRVSGGRAQNAWIAVFLVEADGDLQAATVVATPPPAAGALESAPPAAPVGAP